MLLQLNVIVFACQGFSFNPTDLSGRLAILFDDYFFSSGGYPDLSDDYPLPLDEQTVSSDDLPEPADNYPIP